VQNGNVYSNTRGYITSGLNDDNANPAINDAGEIVWEQQVGGVRQIFSNTRGQLTSEDANHYLPSLNENRELVWQQISGYSFQQIISNLNGLITSGDGPDHRWPDINNHGEIVWESLGKIFKATPIPVNQPPVADAGPDQTPFVTDTVTLDGSGSSDPDGDPLTYFWSITSQPIGSTTNLSDPNAVNPTFLVDKFGTYVIQLIVNDGTVDSVPDTVTIITKNSPPNAVALLDPPPGGTIFFGDTATLDGSGSSDVDEQPLTFQWSFTSLPPGSTTTLSDPTAVNPTFFVDVVGTYVVQLIVNDGFVDSAPKSVNIVTGNFLPIADAGPDQRVLEKSSVVLDGSNSSDKDDGIQTYSWEQTDGPRVTLSDGDKVQASFTTPEVEDNEEITLTFMLTVTDAGGQKASDSTEVVVYTDEKEPVANAGFDQPVFEGTTVTLDGSGSYDPDGDSLSYKWSQISGVPVTLSDPLADKPTFVTPIVGPGGVILSFELTVRDGGGNEDSDQVSVIVYDNGISGFPDDVLTMTCSTGKEIGIKVESDLVSITTVDPATIPDSSDKPDNLPYGLFDLLIKADAVGGTAKVTFYLQTQAGVNDKWFKYKNSTGTWEDCSAYAVFNAARDQVTLTLVDGGNGDDGPADGWIVDPSGLSSPAATTSSGGGGGGGGGCFIQTLGM
jgi:hypothetical protein